MVTKPFLIASAANIPALVSSSFPCTSSAFLSPSRWMSQHSPSRFRNVDNNVVRASATPPGKGDLYNDEELFELLNLHQALNPVEEKGLFSGGGFEQEDNVNLNEESIAGGIHDWILQTLNDDGNASAENKSNPPLSGTMQGGDPTEASAIPGLHELVLETINDIESPSLSELENNSPSVNQLAYDNLQKILREKKPSIRAIATDVDGTLLSGKELHPTTEEAVLKAIDQAYGSGSHDSEKQKQQKVQHFFPATGKSRRGAVGSLGPIIGPLLSKCPGVYIQGLYCVDEEGNVVFEKKLSASAVRSAEELVADFDMSIVGYDGDDLYTTEQTDVVISLSDIYGEPTVELINGGEGGNDSVSKLGDHKPGLHKLLLMDEDVEKIALFRPKLEDLAKDNDATVTQAIPTMLELLPAGCSKAHGVEKVCEALGIDPANELLALGDAENDCGMLEMASIGVAVGNACPQARDSADFIMREQNDEGGAGLAMNLFGFDV